MGGTWMQCACGIDVCSAPMAVVLAASPALESRRSLKSGGRWPGVCMGGFLPVRYRREITKS
jgi:hypothetical protein